MGDFSSILSFSGLAEAVRKSAGRFPLTVCYLLLLSVWLMFLIVCPYDKTPPDHFVFSTSYLTAVGVPLTLAVYLWSELRPGVGKLAMAVGNLLLWADFIFILCNEDVSETWALGRAAIITALCIAVFFIPVKSERSWAYTFISVKGAGISILFSGLFALCWLIITLTIQELFQLSGVAGQVIIMLEIPGALTLPFMLFLSLIPAPDKFEAESKEAAFGKFCSGAVKFFLLPLTLIYFVVLYLYLIKIVASWSLPTDSVSWPVALLTAAVLIVLWGLEGVGRKDPSDASVRLFPRLLVYLIFPLLALASVAIFYRVGEYGWTTPRLYVATFNLWCYATFLYLALSKRRRLNRVAMSFAVIFVAVSIIPYANFSYIGSRLEREDKAKKPTAATDRQEIRISLADDNPVHIPDGFTEVTSSKISSYSWKDDPEILKDGKLEVTAENETYFIPVDSLFVAYREGLDEKYFSVKSLTGKSVFCVRSISFYCPATAAEHVDSVWNYRMAGFIFSNK